MIAIVFLSQATKHVYIENDSHGAISDKKRLCLDET